ncbi:MAG TPA: hypothetical protein VGN20_18050 [Mucilaginibacter sp.]|jgi:hypothetical protein
MKKLKYLNLLLTAVLFCAGCGTTTDIMSSYKAPGVGVVSYKKMFVSALTDNASVRQTVENELARYMTEKGIVVVKSSDVFPPNFHSTGEDKDKDVVLSKIKSADCDGILTVAMVNKETETRYVQGSGPVGPYYGSFGAYYGYGYGSFYSPGYYTEDKVYYLQTNIFDAKTEKLVWSAQSKTYNPSSLQDFLPGYEKAITEQIIKDGLVAAPAKK